MQTKKFIKVMRGLPCSGKTHSAKKLVEEDKEIGRVSRDDLRDMLFNYRLSNRNEKIVTEIRDFIIHTLIKHGRSIVLDETSLNPAVQAHMQQIVTGTAGAYELEIINHDKDVELCVLDDMKRARPVGSKSILQMYRKYIEPNEKLRQKDEAERNIINDETKPTAIISDIDGTVSLLNGRNPYDTGSCLQDGPNRIIIETLLSLTGPDKHKLIFVTGRDEKFRDVTLKWLNQYFNPTDYMLCMRPTGKSGKDYIIKEELLREYVLHKYSVLMAFDDRPRCSRMYRKLGIQHANVGLNCEW